VKSLSPHAARDTEYSHGWPAGGPFPPQNLCRLSVSWRLGYQGVGFALSVPTPQGWLRSRERNAKVPHKQWPCVLHLHPQQQPLRLPVLRHLGRGSAGFDLRAYGQEATLSTGSGSAYWPDGTQVTRKPRKTLRADVGPLLRSADRQNSAPTAPRPRSTRSEPSRGPIGSVALPRG
jgi:hypothetical protein